MKLVKLTNGETTAATSFTSLGNTPFFFVEGVTPPPVILALLAPGLAGIGFAVCKKATKASEKDDSCFNAT